MPEGAERADERANERARRSIARFKSGKTVQRPTETRKRCPIKISNLLAVTVARQEQINLGNLRDGRRTAGQFRVRVRTREGCFRSYIDLSRFESTRERTREKQTEREGGEEGREKERE